MWSTKTCRHPSVIQPQNCVPESFIAESLKVDQFFCGGLYQKAEKHPVAQVMQSLGRIGFLLLWPCAVAEVAAHLVGRSFFWEKKSPRDRTTGGWVDLFSLPMMFFGYPVFLTHVFFWLKKKNRPANHSVWGLSFSKLTTGVFWGTQYV